MTQPKALYLAELLQSEPGAVADAAAEELRRLHLMTRRTLTDEVIADLWHQNGGFHHHFARAVERWKASTTASRCNKSMRCTRP